MKSEIDSLMNSRNLDAIFIVGPCQHNPPMVYFTGIHNLTYADLIKKRGEPPILFHYSMERDEAARTGLTTRLIDRSKIDAYIRELNGNTVAAMSRYYQDMFTDIDLTSGRVAVFGWSDIGRAYTLLSEIQKLIPELEFIGELDRSVLLAAMETKSSEEVERIRGIGQIATGIIGQVSEFITSHRTHNEIVIKSDGSPLTVGDIKRKINLWLAEAGAENPEGTIFAIGYDAGVPHSTGNPADALRMGQTIVFDFFPREAGGGYFYDITRTWCLGYATDEAYSLYEDVLQVYNTIRSKLRLGALCRDYQNLACDLFEKRGHPTLRSDPTTTDGYVHSLGHGVGLSIHEMPTFRAIASDEDLLKSGVVITVEPGLYYPQRGLGVRLEDTVWARPDGVFETLAEYPLDLVLPMKRAARI